jgi:hypothetical protein
LQPELLPKGVSVQKVAAVEAIFDIAVHAAIYLLVSELFLLRKVSKISS